MNFKDLDDDTVLTNEQVIDYLERNLLMRDIDKISISNAEIVIEGNIGGNYGVSSEYFSCSPVFYVSGCFPVPETVGQVKAVMSDFTKLLNEI